MRSSLLALGFVVGCSPSSDAPEQEEEADATLVEDPLPWPEEIPSPSEDPSCNGALLVVWIRDLAAVVEITANLAPLGGRTAFSSSPGILTHGPSDAPCGYADAGEAFLALPSFRGAVVSGAPEFEDYPHDWIDACPCSDGA